MRAGATPPSSNAMFYSITYELLVEFCDSIPQQVMCVV
jgi:hypothetical protein